LEPILLHSLVLLHQAGAAHNAMSAPYGVHSHSCVCLFTPDIIYIMMNELIMPLTIPQGDGNYYNYYYGIVVLLHQKLSINVNNPSQKEIKIIQAKP